MNFVFSATLLTHKVESLILLFFPLYTSGERKDLRIKKSSIGRFESSLSSIASDLSHKEKFGISPSPSTKMYKRSQRTFSCLNILLGIHDEAFPRCSIFVEGTGKYHAHKKGSREKKGGRERAS